MKIIIRETNCTRHEDSILIDVRSIFTKVIQKGEDYAKIKTQKRQFF